MSLNRKTLISEPRTEESELDWNEIEVAKTKSLVEIAERDGLQIKGP